MVVPSFSTLLSDPALQIISDLTPVLSAMESHLVNKHAVFFFCPRAFDHFRIQNFLPTVETLYICSTVKSLRDALPVFWPHLLD